MLVRKSWCVALVLLVTTQIGVQAQEKVKRNMSYQSMWKQVEVLQQKDLPRSAEEQVQAIWDKALKEKNFGQAAKAGLTLMGTRQRVSTDSLKVDVDRLETYLADGSMTVAERALLHVLAASVYAEMLDHTQLTHNDDEAKAAYEKKRDDHVAASLSEKASLVGVKAETFAPLYKAGADRRLYGDDVLSLVVRFVDQQFLVKGMPLVELYRECADLYEQHRQRDASVLCTLRSLQVHNGLVSYKLMLRPKDYEKALEELYKANLDTESGADVYETYLKTVTGLTYQEHADMARWAQKQWKKSKLLPAFQNMEADALTPGLSLRIHGDVLPGKMAEVTVNHRQLEAMEFMARRLDGSNEVVWTRNMRFDHFAQHPDSVEEWQEDTLHISLPPGHFELVAMAGGKTSKEEVTVTSLKVMMFTLPGERKVATVVDAVTGKPVVGCKVTGSWSERVDKTWKDLSEEYVTDQHGQAVLNSKVTEAYAQLGLYDRSNRCSSSGNWSMGQHDEKIHLMEDIFTDRAIYRPGQTVHVSAFIYEKKEDETHAVEDMNVEFELRDANWQVVEQVSGKTDRFGTAAVDFTLPTDRLNGQFCIKMNDTYHYFRVEEYKRPTFTVEIEPVTGTFSLGDSVDVKGVAKTYSGVPVQGAKVAYTVKKRKTNFWTWWNRNDKWDDGEQGELVTDDDGRFSVKIFLDNDAKLYDSDVMAFQLTADVTDLGGETHQASTTVRVGNREFALRTDMDDDLEVGTDAMLPAIKVEACNVQGQPVQANGTWELMQWNRETRKYDIPVSQGSFTTAEPLRLPLMADFRPGTYSLRLKSVDSKERSIEWSKTFVLWSPGQEGKPMNLATDWLHASTSVISPTQSADIWLAGAHEDAYTYLYIVDSQQVVRQVFSLQGTEMRHFHLDYREDFADGVHLFLAYVKDGNMHSLRHSLTYEQPDKHLQLSWKTFRDKLQPGQQETWTLSVLDKDGHPVPAQLLATMYDASLDVFAQHSLPFSLYFKRFCPHVGSSSSGFDYYRSIHLGFTYNERKEYTRTYNSLTPYGQYTGRRHMREYDDGMIPLPEPLSESQPMLMRSAQMKANVTADTAEESAATTGNNGAEVALRENFDETAFFYPSLLTDAAGNVNISFTLPESLTEWNVLALAHTTDMDYGHLSSKVVARKDFIVQPNMPRFVRTGDALALSAKIINTTDKGITGTAQLQLLDPETNRPVHTSRQAFNAQAGGTTAVTFHYQVTDQYPMLVCEITATSQPQGKNRRPAFSDGERNWLPVLTDKKYITESVPFYLQGAEAKDIDITSLFNHQSPTTTQRCMTFEYTANPSWQSVLGLHSVVNPTSDNAIAWAAALYANKMCEHLVSRMPQLKALIQKWNKEDQTHGQSVTLTSELQRNEELKDILLKESPWMLEAQNETQQRQQICQLFDPDLIAPRITQARKKLDALQYSNGGWAWFDGMSPNAYVTLSVCDHLAMLVTYLRSQNITVPSIENMLRKGITFLDEAELDDYNKYWKKNGPYMPSDGTLHYLYLRSLAKPLLTNDKTSVRTMHKDYLDESEKHVRDLTMYGRANLAVIFQANGRTQAAADFAQSLAEYTVSQPGMGRYFDTEKAQYSWQSYRIPTQIAAIKALKTQPDHANLLPDMLLWLMRQKQTQQWNNQLNSIAMCDLLLDISPNLLTDEPRQPNVQMAGQRLTLNTPTAGLGYSKTLVPDALVQKQPTTIHVASASSTATEPGSIAWGCIYGQSLESLDRLEQHGTSLTISRKVYRETRTGGTTDWQEITPGQSLHVGDKLRLRYIITADRDLDFVQVRAQHAACLEPLTLRSGYQPLGGRSGYLSLHDASADIFFDYFRKGTVTIDLDFYVDRTGNYTCGIATAQCAYATDFAGHTGGWRISVE